MFAPEPGKLFRSAYNDGCVLQPDAAEISRQESKSKRRGEWTPQIRPSRLAQADKQRSSLVSDRGRGLWGCVRWTLETNFAERTGAVRRIHQLTNKPVRKIRCCRWQVVGTWKHFQRIVLIGDGFYAEETWPMQWFSIWLERYLVGEIGCIAIHRHFCTIIPQYVVPIHHLVLVQGNDIHHRLVNLRRSM